MKTPKELLTLKEKMRALQSGDFDVEAENPKIVRCWERLQCNRKDCPAYGRLRCWSVAGTCCHGTVQGRFAQKIGDCRKCVVYRESCGDDIGELIEIFNQMAKDIRYNIAAQVRSDEENAKEERVSALKDMAAGVAHETRNPLHSIGMAASFLKKNFHDELITEFLTIIEEEVRKLNDLTTMFLNFAHPRPVERETCDLNELVCSVVDDFREQAQGKKISIHLHRHDDLPEILSDTTRIRASLFHLLENALEASDTGNSITVRTARENRAVTVSVQDNGPGLAPAEQTRIFRPFYTTKSRGPGLGLAMVERAMKDLDGQVEFSSQPGRGATFTLVLPVSPQDREQ